MSTLEQPPAIRPTPAWLSSRRTHLEAEIGGMSDAPGRRLGWRLAIAAVLAVVLLAGTALATNSLGLRDWLRSADPGSARFSIDTTRTVNDPVDSSLVCDEPGDDDFDCVPGARGEWVYEYYERVSASPPLTRESILANLNEVAADGAEPALVAEIRELLDELGDDFFVRLNFAQFMSIGSAEMIRPGVLLLPPEGIPQFVTCEPDGYEQVECRDLAAALGVPVGAPIYGLAHNDHWVERPAPTKPPEPFRIEDYFGRKLTPPEKRFLLLMGVATHSAGGSSEIDSATVTADDGS